MDNFGKNRTVWINPRGFKMIFGVIFDAVETGHCLDNHANTVANALIP